MPPLTWDEREALKRLFDDAMYDVREQTSALRRWRDHLEGLASREGSGDLRVALREAADALRLIQEDLVERLSAMGRAVNQLRERGEL